MLVHSLVYRAEGGWDRPFPALPDGGATLLLAFGAPRFGSEAEPFRELASAYPSAVLAGCSTAGEIAGSDVQDDSISVAIAHFAHTALRRASTPISSAPESREAGAALAAKLTSPDLVAVLLFSDGLAVNGTPLVEGLAAGLPAGVLVSGGLAGDGARFLRTWVLDGALPRSNRVCAVGFYGTRLRVGSGCDGGWADFGPERRITRSDGNVLYELDGKPVLDLYKSYLGERASELPGSALLFPLAVRRSPSAPRSVVRTILAVDEEARSLTFAGDMPEGGVARLMRANNDRLIESAGRAAAAATAAFPSDRPALVVSVSCVGRRIVLGERTEEEIELVAEGTPAGSAHVGFYSYGEISPGLDEEASQLHNQTMTVTVLGEA